MWTDWNFQLSQSPMEVATSDGLKRESLPPRSQIRLYNRGGVKFVITPCLCVSYFISAWKLSNGKFFIDWMYIFDQMLFYFRVWYSEFNFVLNFNCLCNYSVNIGQKLSTSTSVEKDLGLCICKYTISYKYICVLYIWVCVFVCQNYVSLCICKYNTCICIKCAHLHLQADGRDETVVAIIWIFLQ